MAVLKVCLFQRVFRELCAVGLGTSLLSSKHHYISSKPAFQEKQKRPIKKIAGMYEFIDLVYISENLSL